MAFQKGQSGNPAGRPKGVTDRRQAIQGLLMPDAPELVSKAVEKALEGDSMLLKACLDKLIPNCRQRTRVTVEGSGDESTPEKGRSVVRELCDGSLALEEGRLLMEVLTLQSRLEEQNELNRRIEALEQAHGLN